MKSIELTDIELEILRGMCESFKGSDDYTKLRDEIWGARGSHPLINALQYFKDNPSILNDEQKQQIPILEKEIETKFGVVFGSLTTLIEKIEAIR